MVKSQACIAGSGGCTRRLPTEWDMTFGRVLSQDRADASMTLSQVQELSCSSPDRAPPLPWNASSCGTVVVFMGINSNSKFQDCSTAQLWGGRILTCEPGFLHLFAESSGGQEKMAEWDWGGAGGLGIQS